MPVYTYRREDGTTFDLRQKFMDEALTVDPETGQRVSRVIQPAGVIFKGSGFYINDSKSASRSAIGTTPKNEKTEKSEKSEHSEASGHSDSNGHGDSTTHSEKGHSEKTEAKPAATETTSTKTPAAAAAD